MKNLSERMLFFCLLLGGISCQSERIDFVDASGGSLNQESDASFTRSSEMDFNKGASENLLLQTINESGSIKLGNSQVLNDSTLPGLGVWPYIMDIAYDSANNLLYLGGSSAVYVVDTKGSPDFTDDDLIATYDSSSTPSLPISGLYDIDYDTTTGTVFISTRYSGLFWLDVKGNADPTDDVLEHHYTNSSTPSFGHSNNLSYNSTLASNGLLITSGWGQGVRLTDTNGTVDVSDDTEVITMKNGTTPSIGTPWVGDAFYDQASGLIFVGANGVQVIDTNLTPFDSSDDVNLGSLTDSTTPALLCNRTHEVEYDSASGLLFLACDNWQSGTTSGITIIDTKKTATLADDTLFAIYDDTNDFNFSGASRLHQMRYDHATTTLYAPFRHSDGGLIKINLNGTPSKADDEITIYSQGSFLPDTNANGIEIIPELNAVLVGTSSGVAVLQDSFQNLSGSYIFSPMVTSSLAPDSGFDWEAITPSGTDLEVQLTSAPIAFQSGFTDSDVTNITDLHGWGSIHPSITENAGLLTLSGTPGAANYATFWLDTGEASNYFPAGSYVEVKFKVTSTATNLNLGIFEDGYDGGESWVESNGDWQTLTLTTVTDFSSIGFYLSYDSGTWAATDTVEIEYVKIVSKDDWSSWQTLEKGSKILDMINSNDEYITIKANLSSSSIGRTPELKSLSLGSWD